MLTMMVKLIRWSVQVLVAKLSQTNNEVLHWWVRKRDSPLEDHSEMEME